MVGYSVLHGRRLLLLAFTDGIDQCGSKGRRTKTTFCLGPRPSLPAKFAGWTYLGLTRFALQDEVGWRISGLAMPPVAAGGIKPVERCIRSFELGRFLGSDVRTTVTAW